MPGVILIEAVAQFAGVVAQCDPTVPVLENLRLTAVRAAKITGTAEPGETLEPAAEIAGRPLLSTQIVLSGTEPAPAASNTRSGRGASLGHGPTTGLAGH